METLGWYRVIGRAVQLLHKIRRGRHGAAALAGVIGALVTAVLLTVGIVYAPFQNVGVTFALAYVTFAAAFSVVLNCRLRDKLEDVHAAISLEFGLERAGYRVVDFFYDEAAASPTLELIHLKVLRLCHPATVLELGSGQTTKLLSCYARDDAAVEVVSLEQSRRFWERLKPLISHHYVLAEIDRSDFSCRGTGLQLAAEWYRVDDVIKGRKFEYILVDGPDYADVNSKTLRYYRCGILKYIPEILADKFVIVFDDADRPGDRMTIEAMKAVLTACSIRYVSFEKHGWKSQAVVCSPEWGFLRTV